MPPETDSLLSFLEKFFDSQATQNNYKEALKLLKETNLDLIKNSTIIPLLWKARNGNKADELEENLKTLIDAAMDFSVDEQTLLKLNQIYEIVKEENVRYVAVDNFIQSSTEELKSKQKQLGEDLSNLQSLEDVFNQKESDLQKQYITILGIFASIVLTLVGGFVFSTSVLSNIHQATIDRLVFAILCIAFLFFNLLCILVGLILKVSNNNNSGCKCLLVVVDLILGALIALSFLKCYSVETQKVKESEVASSTPNNCVHFYFDSQQTISKSPPPTKK